MPCSRCKSDFNLLNWKIKCGECEEKYCNKCLKRREGVLFCDKCLVLLKRPPDRGKLMELKPKDLQIYLKKHNISTHGLVEKRELVDLFCNRHIPVKQRRGTEKLTANFGCSLPNLGESSSIGEFIGTINNGDFWNITRERPANVRTSPTSTNTSQFESRNQQTHSSTPPSSPNTYGTPSSSSNTTNVPQENPSNLTDTETISRENQNPHESPVSHVKCPKLSELETENDLNQLTAKQLKILLTINRVDYKGCVERKELLDKALILWRDTKKAKEDLSEEFDDVCKLCMDAPLDCVLLECGHIVSCIDCGKRLAECPICRQYVTRVVRTFKA